MDRRDLREGAPIGEDRPGCRDNRRRGQHRRAPRGAGHGGGPIGGGAVLDQVPALADAAGLARRQARRLRRTRGPEEGSGQGAVGHVAALSRALHAQRAGPRRIQAAPDGGRRDPHSLHAGEPGCGENGMARRR